MSDNQTIKDRLKSFIKSLGIGQGAFEKSVGFSNGYVNNIRKSIQPEKLQSIVRIYPQLNPGWLMTGEGGMLREESDNNVDSSREIALLKELLEIKESLLKEKDARLKEQEKLIALMEEKVERMADESGKFTAPSVAIATGGNAPTFRNSFGN